MKRLEVICAVRLIYMSLGAKGLNKLRINLLKPSGFFTYHQV